MNEDDRISTREYIEKIIALRFEAELRERELLSQALKLEAEKLSLRLEGMNEFRGQLAKQAEGFATKQEVQALQRFVDKLLLSAVIALGSLVAGLLLSLLRKP